LRIRYPGLHRGQLLGGAAFGVGLDAAMRRRPASPTVALHVGSRITADGNGPCAFSTTLCALGTRFSWGNAGIARDEKTWGHGPPKSAAISRPNAAGDGKSCTVGKLMSHRSYARRQPQYITGEQWSDRLFFNGIHRKRSS
jgi:hypothetical protein